MTNTRWTIMAALLLAATSAAHAQAPTGPPAGFVPPSGPPSGFRPPSGPPAGIGAPSTGGSVGTAGTADSGSVSNAESTQSTTTSTSSSGIGPDGMAMSGGTMDNSDMMAADTGAMPNTGGEPILMSLIGLSVAVGAFAVRKRVAA